MKVTALHHVRFAVTDLDAAERFGRDFGLHVVERSPDRCVMRTNGGDAFSYIGEAAPARGFLGLAFTVAHREDLEEAVTRHGATPIRVLDTPGGGWGVTLTDPEGLRVDLVTGIADGEAAPSHPLLMLNTPGNVSRHHAAQSTRPHGPAMLYRLGHAGLYVRELGRMLEWYCSVLGLLVSDTMHMPHEPGRQVVGFLRLDRGDALVDHHTLFLAQSGKTDCHHISFETQDFEAQFSAHRWLMERGWTPNWGVGRHPLGSHVFDVWFDPDAYRWETFSDTDLVDATRQAGNHDIHGAQIDLWRSDPPDRYFA